MVGEVKAPRVVKQGSRTMTIRSKDLQRQLMWECYDLRRRGATVREIERLKNVPQTTVFEYLTKASRSIDHETRSIDLPWIAVDFWAEHKRRVKDLNIAYINAVELELKVKILEQLRKESEGALRTAAELGLIAIRPLAQASGDVIYGEKREVHVHFDQLSDEQLAEQEARIQREIADVEARLAGLPKGAHVEPRAAVLQCIHGAGVEGQPDGGEGHAGSDTQAVG